MDILTFIVEIVKAVAWPLAAVFVALLFRDQLRALLARMKKGKLGPAEFEFEETVKELEEETAELKREKPAEIEPVPSSAKVDAHTLRLARSDPRATIMNAWLEVETELAHLAQTKNLLPPGDSRNAVRAIRTINKARLLEPIQISLLNDLRDLRNQAAHVPDFNPSTESVISYVQMAKELAGVLHNAAEVN